MEKTPEENALDRAYNRKLIRGTTLINHSVRSLLKLTCDEYSLMDFIHDWNFKYKGSQSIPLKDYWVSTGFDPRRVGERLGVLYEKGLIEEVDGIIKTTSLWNENFFEGRFGELWAINNKGSKPNARRKYHRCMKFVDHDNLQKAYEDYVAYQNHNEYKIKTLESFLSPESRLWESDWSFEAPVVVNPNVHPGNFLTDG